MEEISTELTKAQKFQPDTSKNISTSTKSNTLKKYAKYVNSSKEETKTVPMQP